MGSVETEDDRLWKLEARAVGAGAAAGFVAGIGMGVVLQFGTGILPVLGGLVGRVSLLRGWVVHMFISVVYGVLFAVFVAYPPVQSFLDTFEVVDYVLAGITYAVMIAAVTIAALPFVFEVPTMTTAARPPFPNIPGPMAGGLLPAALLGVGHIVYGAILGAIYAVIGETAD